MGTMAMNVCVLFTSTHRGVDSTRVHRQYVEHIDNPLVNQYSPCAVGCKQRQQHSFKFQCRLDWLVWTLAGEDKDVNLCSMLRH